MTNLNFFYFLALLILVSKNVLLLNEETLILICFTIFCFISTQKLSDSVFNYFEDEKKNIKNSLNQNISSNIYLINSGIKSNKKVLFWNNEFLNLKIHLNSFNKRILLNLPLLQEHKIKEKLLKKFLFFKRLEQQSSKLILLLVSERIERIVNINKFCTSNFKYYSAINKINTREYLKNI